MGLAGVRLAALYVATARLMLPAAAGSSGVMLDVPFVAQPKNGCGAASIAMVMQYWERNRDNGHTQRADVETIQRELYSAHAKGIFASAMERYFQSAGYRTFTLRGAWSDLRENLEKGRPLIIGLAPGRSRDPLHYVVVAGLDWQNDWIFVNDPAQRKLLKIGRAEFEKEWSATQDWMLLALPQQGK
jgi:ABC-type bacteriocin/lantibiotic exporter with double-glycine peptidase domain